LLCCKKYSIVQTVVCNGDVQYAEHVYSRLGNVPDEEFEAAGSVYGVESCQIVFLRAISHTSSHTFAVGCVV